MYKYKNSQILFISFTLSLLAWLRSLNLGATQDDLIFLEIARKSNNLHQNLTGYLWPDYFRPLTTSVYFEVLSKMSSSYKTISVIGHSLNYLIFLISSILMYKFCTKKSKYFSLTAILLVTFFLSPAFAMPLGWISGEIDLIFYMLAITLVILVDGLKFETSKKYNLIIVLNCLALILTKETGFLLVLSLCLALVLNRSFILLKFLVPIMILACVVISQLNSYIDFNLIRIIDLVTSYINCYNHFYFGKEIILIYSLAIFILFFVSMKGFRQKEQYIQVLQIFSLASMAVFVFSERPTNLDGYYILPTLWAMTIIANHEINDFNLRILKVTFFKVTAFCLAILVMYFNFTQITKMPRGLASASEFQSIRTYKTNEFIMNTNRSQISLCKPENGVFAALGYGSFVRVFTNNATIIESTECDAVWEDENWKLVNKPN